MRNFFEIIKGELHFNKFQVNDFIGVEYSCPLEDEKIGLFSQSDYIVHVLSGQKTWKTMSGQWTMKPGETLYLKKGAALIRQFFDEEFCMLGFFIPDDLIRESLSDVAGSQPPLIRPGFQDFTAALLPPNPLLDGYFQSVLSYFRQKGKPQDYLLKLKMKELLVNVLYNNDNPSLAAYLASLTQTGEPSLPQLMEANFCYNLSLEEFAKLCHRSLSTFKRDFQNHYRMSPGRWLLRKRLEHAAGLLLHDAGNITQVAFECGFEDVSHFSRAFKQKFHRSPSEYRKSVA